MHDEVVRRLTQHILADGSELSEEDRMHLGSCLSCLEALGLLSELVESGSSEWYQTVADQLPCEATAAEMHTYAALEAQQLAEEKPWVAEHLRSCGTCQERYVSAREVLQAAQDGLFGPPLELATSPTSIWRRVADKGFEIVGELQVVVQQGLIGIQDLPAHLAAYFYSLSPSEASRSSRSDTATANALEVGLELTPPTLAERLKVRLLPEADGHWTLHIEPIGEVVENIPLVLYGLEPRRKLHEARSLGPHRAPARFERLPPGRYALEIRSPSDTSVIPFNMRGGGGNAC